MALYLTVMLAMLAGYYWKVNEDGWKKKAFCIVSAAVLIYFAALRAVSVGADTPQFFNAYEKIASSEWTFRQQSGFGGRFETGFFVLCRLLGYISKDGQLLLIVTSVFSLSVLCWFIYRNSSDVVFSLLAFVGFQFYAFYLTAMRQVLAISIVLIGLEMFLCKRKYLGFILTVLFACLFHDSAFFALAMLPMYLLKPSKGLLSLCAIVLFVVFFGFRQLFEIAASLTGFSAYLGSEFDEANYFAGAIKALLSVIVLFVMGYSLRFGRERERRLLSQKRDRVEDFFIWLQVATVFLSVLSMRAIIIERICCYFNFFGFLILPQFLKKNVRKEDEKTFKILLVLLAFAYCATVLLFRPEWTKVTPYLFYFQAP